MMAMIAKISFGFWFDRIVASCMFVILIFSNNEENVKCLCFKNTLFASELHVKIRKTDFFGTQVAGIRFLHRFLSSVGRANDS